MNRYQSAKLALQRLYSEKKLPAGSMAKYEAKQLKLRTNPMIIRKFINISNGTTIDLIDAQTEKVYGVSSFRGNQLDDFVNHVFDNLRIRSGSHATDEDKAGSVAYTDAVLQAIVNATLIVTLGNDTLFEIPCSSIVNQNVGASMQDDFAYLGKWYALTSKEDIGAKLKFAPVATGGGTKDYVEVTFDGFTTVPN